MSNWRQRLEEDYLDYHQQANLYALREDIPSRLEREFELMFTPFFGSDLRPKTLLDLGCGTGALVQWLDAQEGIEAVGVDASRSQIQAARRLRPNSRFEHGGGLEYLRDHPESFDGIMCMDVVEHLPTLDATIELLEAASDALRPGGFFFCRVPNAGNLIAPHSLFTDLTHVRLYSSQSLVHILRLAGFGHPRIVPIQSGHLTGRVRLVLEHWLHAFVYRIAGRPSEKVFTRNVCAVGFRANDHRLGDK